MNRRGYLILAAVLIVAAVGAVVFAAAHQAGQPRRRRRPRATAARLPTLVAKGWINTTPLTKADLRGKVVLYDFWTYSCVNCVRTIPSLRSWYDRYRKDGLVRHRRPLAGVRLREEPRATCARAVKKLGVDYPWRSTTT